MDHERNGDCEFCDPSSFDRAAMLFESSLSFFAADTALLDGVLPGAGVICPRAHRESPFDLSDDEWLDTHAMLKRVKAAIDATFRPDGYNLIWNVKPVGGQVAGHAHLHVIPRFHDEPFAGRGARWLLKQSSNKRPAPHAPGRGLAL